MKLAFVVSIAALILAVAVVPFPTSREQVRPAEGWRTFDASWNATGQRRVLPTEAGRTASTSYLSGAVTMLPAKGIARGFQGEVIAFDDGAGTSVGRAVWTDERGDQVFSRLSGDAMRAGRRIVATITGGTGRYSGIEGEYAFEWQYVIDAGEGAIQGRAVGLEGRFRLPGGAR